MNVEDLMRMWMWVWIWMRGRKEVVKRCRWRWMLEERRKWARRKLKYELEQQ
jgi:hypothetical protein